MTDAFEKLAELVGASVEAAPSQGMPRTRAEALALGLPRYFTGKPCKHGHVAERGTASKGCVECFRQYNATKEATERKRQRMRQYNASTEGRERSRQHDLRRRATPEWKEYARQYRCRPEIKERERQLKATPEFKESKRRRNMAKTGDATLFAINQAMWAATRASAPSDIVPQCPEPHRSQLQALVDRIRADPTAGKAVIGLLRAMRDLRKLEIAEQNTKDDTTASRT